MFLLQFGLGALFGIAAATARRGSRAVWGSLALLALAGGAITAAMWEPPSSAGPRIRVISVLDAPTTNALVAAFTAETGIACDVDPFAGGTQTTVELIQQGRVQPDVLLGGTVEIHEQLSQAGKLARFDPAPDAGRVTDHDDPEGRWTPLYLGYLGLVYRPLPTLLSHPPEWVTLLQPQWKGRVTIPSPAASGGGLVFLATQLQRQADEETGWKFLQLLIDADARFEDRSNIPITRVANGTMDLGVAWAHDVQRRREVERIPVELRIPQRTGYEVGGVSILGHARDLASARAFVQFLTGKQAAEIQVREGRRVPLRSDVDPPTYLQGRQLGGEATAFYDRARVLEHRAEWVARWESLQYANP